MLGLQQIVVKCSAAIFLRMVVFTGLQGGGTMRNPGGRVLLVNFGDGEGRFCLFSKS